MDSSETQEMTLMWPSLGPSMYLTGPIKWTSWVFSIPYIYSDFWFQKKIPFLFVIGRLPPLSLGLSSVQMVSLNPKSHQKPYSYYENIFKRIGFKSILFLPAYWDTSGSIWTSCKTFAAFRNCADFRNHLKIWLFVLSI